MTKPYVTPGSVNYDIQAAVLPTNIIQTSFNSLNLDFFNLVPTMDDVIELKILARAVGLIDIPSFWTSSFTDVAVYNYYFFKNINLLIAQKKANDLIQSMNFGQI